ncbi:MAG: DUF1697 domain-containing protein [Sphingomonas sp.]
MRWAALLKGINIGGKKIPMTELRALVEGLGCRDVKTLLASGNVAFSCDEEDGAALEKTLEATLADYGLKTDVVVRSGAELSAVMDANPFPDAARDHPNHLLVAFHRDPVPDGLIDKIPDIYDGPERLTAIGRELYIDFPDDVGHSKLPQAMARLKFPKLATMRNWNTVGKLRDLLE